MPRPAISFASSTRSISPRCARLIQIATISPILFFQRRGPVLNEGEHRGLSLLDRRVDEEMLPVRHDGVLKTDDSLQLDRKELARRACVKLIAGGRDVDDHQFVLRSDLVDMLSIAAHPRSGTAVG